MLTKVTVANKKEKVVEDGNLVKEFFKTYSKIAGSIKEIAGPRGSKLKKEVLSNIIDDMKRLEELL